jgi:hypothetical protein
MAYRGLREVELLGGGREAPALHHFDEGSELIQVEAAHPYKVL